MREPREARRAIGIVPQELALYEDLSTVDNLRYWGAAYGLRGGALESRIEEVLGYIGLGDRAHDLPSTFSGGMKRRLNFGCGIVHRPQQAHRKRLEELAEGTMAFFLASVLKDLRGWRRDPASLLIWLGLPLFVGGLVTGLMEGGAQPTGTLLVSDRDGSLVSQAVPRALDAGLGELLEVQSVSENEGRTRLEEGDASALLAIPEGFGDAVKRDEGASLRLLTNPAQTIMPRIIEEGLQILLDASFYLRAVFGDEVDTVVGWVETDTQANAATVAELAVSIRSRLETASGERV